MAELLSLTFGHTGFGQIFLQLRALPQVIARCTTHIVRYQERQTLAYAFAPRRGIIQVQTFGFVLRISCLFQIGVSTTHGLPSILLIGKDVSATYTHTYGKRCKEHQTGYHKVFPLLCLGGYRQFGKEQYAYHHTDVIRHLRVNEESYRYEEHDQQCAQPIPLSVRQVEPYHHRHHPCDGYRLAAMLRRYDYKEVRRHSYCKCTGYAQPLIDAERAQQRKERQQVEQEDEERHLRSQKRQSAQRTKDG